MGMGNGFINYPEHIAKEVVVPNQTLPEMLEASVKTYPDHEALTFYGRTMSYRQLFGGVRAFASALQANGLKQGDRFAIMLPNCPQFVIAYYGILMAGGIVTQINPMLVERELLYILKDSGAKGIIVLDAIHDRVKAVQPDTDLRLIITVSLLPSKEPEVSALSFDAFLQNGMLKSPRPILIDPKEEVAVLQYTGGTTGRSKGAMLTHYNLLANVLQSYEFFKDETSLGTERTLAVIPLYHVFGMTSCMNLSIYTGGSLILLPRFDIQEVLQTIQREKPTIFPGVPTMYVALTHFPNVESYGVDTIRICNSGSAPMPVNLLKVFEQKTGAMVLEGYGLSEASPTTHCNPPFAERRPGSVGIGVPSTTYRIVDELTGEHDVPIGERGELIIRGPQVMKGYWNLSEETAHALRDGWLFTGDIAQMDEDGYVYIVDRKKDMIIAGGYNIYPREIEEVIYEHPAVKEAAVIGVRDEYRGETVKAYIVLKDGVTAAEEDIIAFCKTNMAPYKVPKLVEFREELPKTNVGKVLRRALREQANQDV